MAETVVQSARPQTRLADTAKLAKRKVVSASFHARHARYFPTWRRFKPLTMVPPRRFVDNLDLVRRWTSVRGDIVECGVWKGGMSGAIAVTAPGHHSVLFDSFEGLPVPTALDGKHAMHWSKEIRTWDNCTAEEALAHEAMRRAGSVDHEIIKGWFEDTVPVWAKEERPIAILRLDGDWYDSTMVCLRNLFPLVVPGGGVIIDDYYDWDGCSRAIHDYLSETQGAERIRMTPHGVAYLEKLAPEQ